MEPSAPTTSPDTPLAPAPAPDVATVPLADPGEVTALRKEVRELHARLGEDAAARARLERLAAQSGRLHALSEALSEAGSPEEVAHAVVALGVEALGADAGALSLLTPDGERLDIVAHRGYPPEVLRMFASYSAHAKVPVVDALAAHAPIWLHSPADVGERYPALQAAHPKPVHQAWAVLPLEVAGRPLGGLSFDFLEERDFAEEERSFAQTLARQCAVALDRALRVAARIEDERRHVEEERAARDQAEAVGRRLEEALEQLRFLSHAGAALASSLDYEVTLDTVARVLVPAFADYCTVDVVDEAGRDVRAAAAHRDPTKRQLLFEIATTYTQPAEPPSFVRELLGGRPVVVEDVTPEVADEYRRGQSPRHVELARALDARSWALVPMHARGRRVGLLTVGTVRDGARRIGAAELGMVEEVARRAAVAIENARLYRELERMRGAAEQERAALLSLFQQAPTPILICRGPDLRIELANAWMARLVGPRPLVGRGLREALPELDGQGLLERYDDVLRTGEPFVGSEVPLRLAWADRPHGEERFFTFVIQPLRAADGRVDAVMTICFEVTEDVLARRHAEEKSQLLEQAERARAESEERLRMAVESAGLGTFDFAPETDELHVDERARAAFGVAPAVEARYRSFHARVHPDDRERAEAALARALDPASGGEYVSEFRTVGDDGRERWVAARGRALYQGRRCVRLLGTLLDVTERRRAEEERGRLLDGERAARALAESARRRATQLNALATSLSQALTPSEVADVVVRDTLAALGARSGAVGLLSSDGAFIEWIGPDAEAAGPDASVDPARVPLDAALPAAEAVRTRSIVWVSTREETRGRYPALDAQRGLEAWGAVPLVFEHRVVGALGLGFAEERTLTDDERQLLSAVARQCAQALERARLYQAAETARAQAEAASRAKDEFLAMLGHELRNPLAPIVTALELLRLRQPAGNGDAGREREVIERQVAHLVRLVDDLLDVSRITRGKVQLKRAPVEICAVVRKAIEMASPLLEERSHRLDVDLTRAGLLVDGDEVRLAQVFANLLTNAAKYTDAGGRIAVAAAREGSDAVVTVRDSGVGISPGLLPSVFDLFVQGERAPDRAEGGLGIGLTLVKSLVELHGGRVSAASEGRGRGSVFTVRLPALAAEPRRDPTPLPPPTIAHPRGGGRRVLLVDDNVDAAELLGDLLREAGHEVEVAHDGPHALERLGRFTPEIAILDIGLPVMDGYELARQIQARGGPTPRLVALTGYGQDTDRARSRAAGFARHLVKPIDVKALLALLDEEPAAEAR